MRNWVAYHKFEDKYKSAILRRMSEKDSLDILRELYQFAGSLKNNSLNTIDSKKINNLARVHSVFGKIK